jgi:hypothetical protein
MKNITDLSGKKFGKLTVVSLYPSVDSVRTYWKCKCDCGRERIVVGANLKAGYTKSCGKNKCRINFIDMTGKRIGKLIVLSQSSEKNKNKKLKWLCKCDCGNELTIVGTRLRRGIPQSCGCDTYKRISQKLRKNPPYKWLFNKIKYRAKTNQKKLKLTYEEFLEFTKVNVCHYCNGKVEWQEHRSTKDNKGYNIDRINSTKGYTKENCVVCCKICNRMKNILGEQEFLSQIKRIYENQQLSRKGVNPP